jgi:hypothetical protein
MTEAWSRGGVTGAAQRTGERATHSRVLAIAARAGLAARAVVYILVGWLAIDIATGHGHREANQKGALADVASRTGGSVLLVILTAGLFGYAVWQLARAAFGTAERGKDAGPRLRSLCSAIFYGGLGIAAITVLTGSSRSGQAQQQAGWTARAMQHTGGRWLVGLIGAVFVVVGVVMVWEGVARKFRDQLRTSEMSRTERRVVEGIGAFGSTARGVVIAVAGALVIDAAVTADPKKSTGLDGALRTLAQQPMGPWLLGLAAAGLIVFGGFSLACVRYQRV